MSCFLLLCELGNEHRERELRVCKICIYRCIVILIGARFLFTERNSVTRGHNLRIRKHLLQSSRLFNSFLQ